MPRTVPLTGISGALGKLPRSEWVPINWDHLRFLLLRLGLESFTHLRLLPESVPCMHPSPDALLRMLGSGVYISPVFPMHKLVGIHSASPALLLWAVNSSKTWCRHKRYITLL